MNKTKDKRRREQKKLEENEIEIAKNKEEEYTTQ